MMIPLGFFGGATQASYELISTVIISGSSTSSVTFTNSGAWNNYKHLQLRIVSRGGRAATDDDFFMQFNGDTASNYSRHYLAAFNAAPGGYSSSPATSLLIGSPTGNSSAANVFGAQIVDILDPFSTTKNKTIRSFAGATAVNYIELLSGAWYNSSTAVSSLTIFPYTTIFAGSRFSLYGIRG